MRSSRKIKTILLLIVSIIIMGFLAWIYKAEYTIKNETIEPKNTLKIIEKEKLILGYVQKMRVTCYSLVEFASTGKTASGKWVADGMVASNVLPFGTQVKIEGFGDKVFVVEDRFMSGWTGADLDVYWGDGLSAYKDCVQWGKKNLEVLVLQNKDSVFTK